MPDGMQMRLRKRTRSSGWVQLQQNCRMTDIKNLMGGAGQLELAAAAERAAKLYRLPAGFEAQLSAMDARMKPWRDFAKRFEAIDSYRGIRAAMVKNGLMNKTFNEVAQIDVAASLAQLQDNPGLNRFIKQLAEMDSTIKASAAQLAKYPTFLTFLEDINRNTALTAASVDWQAGIAGISKRLRGGLGDSSFQALLANMAKASERRGEEQILAAAQLLDEEGASEEISQLVHGVTEGISKALTTQEAVDQIVLAIQATNEPQYRWVLVAIFFPLLLWFASPFWNSYVDFHVKKNLEGTSTQATNKQVKEAAREAVGDLRLLRDYRFVTAQSLAVRSEPKDRAQVLGHLRLGQTVHVLGKEQGFTLVAWRSEDGNAELKGWVFSRYLKRFQ